MKEKSETNKEKQSKRMEVLNQLARAAGWAGWSQFETAVKNGKIVVPGGKNEAKNS